jgi:hypothetical protein
MVGRARNRDQAFIIAKIHPVDGGKSRKNVRF